MGSWLDKLPSNEKRKIQERFRMSPAAYEKMRQSVKGPEDLKQELQWNEAMAQLRFTLETEEKAKQALKQHMVSEMATNGLESIVENAELPAEIQKKLEEGSFDITVDAPSEDAADQLVLVPEGNIIEKIPVQFSLSESYVSQIMSE